MAFTTSQAGIDLIKSFEDCRLTAYQDSVGVWTIGYGHTNGVYAGMTITQAQAEEFLFFASTFSSKMQIDFLKVAWGISPVLHFLCRHSFRCRRGAVAGIQSLLVTDM